MPELADTPDAIATFVATLIASSSAMGAHRDDVRREQGVQKATDEMSLASRSFFGQEAEVMEI
ncbi:MAG: hypothetical protein ACLVKA_08865 [Collinsella aerofaciens]